MSHSSLTYYLPSILLGMFFGAPVAFVLFLLTRSRPARTKLRFTLVLSIICAVLLIGLVILQVRASSSVPGTNFGGEFLALYAIILTILVPFGIYSVFWYLDVKHAELPARYRLALMLGGCGFATIGYLLPWFQDYSLSTPAQLHVYTGALLDATPPYYITLFSLGNFPYALLFTLIALALMSVLTFLRDRYSVFVEFFGRGLHGIQTFILLLAAGTVGGFSISGKNGSLLPGFWLAVFGFVLIFVGQYWPYFDKAKPNKLLMATLSIALLVVAIFVVRVGKEHIGLSVAKALGGSGAANVIAAFVLDILGPGLLAAGFGAVSALIAANKDESGASQPTR